MYSHVPAKVSWLTISSVKARNCQKLGKYVTAQKKKKKKKGVDVRSPNRLSDHCRARDDTELARRRKRPFSWSDKYLEEYKQRAEPLLGERLSFVFVTLCDTDSQHHSLRCVCLCVHVRVYVQTQLEDHNLPPPRRCLFSISAPALLASENRT